MEIIELIITILPLASLGFTALVFASAWVLFKKAGKPGWASLVPVYNAVVFMQIASKPAWWVILLFVPLANVVVSILACLSFAKAYGRGTGHGVGLFLLPMVFLPIMAFSKSSKKESPKERKDNLKDESAEELHQDFEEPTEEFHQIEVGRNDKIRKEAPPAKVAPRKIRFSCPSCRQSMATQLKFMGRKTPCPKCGDELTIPSPKKAIA